MPDIFDSLFGSRSRARLLRLFILNPEKELTPEDIAEKTQVPRREISRLLGQFKKFKIILERSRRGKKSYLANVHFDLYTELKSLFSNPSFDVDDKAFRKLRGAGDVRLVLVSGLFLKHPKSKADMILVANNVSRAKLRAAITALEAETGQEVRFVLMTLEELQYRLNMMDRFLMEFVEQPYEEVINKVPEFKRFVAGIRR